MDITEGKSTGIPTIAAAMKANGSPAVKYEFDDSYSWFMATIPVRPVFLNDTVNETENDTVLLSQLSKRQQFVLKAIAENDKITEMQSITQQKTTKTVTIERNKYTRAILEKYQDVELPGGAALPGVSNQKRNDALKVLFIFHWK